VGPGVALVARWTARRALIAALLLAAIGLAVASLADQPVSLPVGVVVLAVAAAVAAVLSAAVGAVVGGLAAVVVAVRLVVTGPVDQLLFREGNVLAAGRWLQAFGLVAAVVSALVLLLRRPGADVSREPPGSGAPTSAMITTF